MPRGDCGARCNTVDPATRWCCALVEAYARRGLAQRRDRCHRPKQPAGLEDGVWISPAFAGRDADVPLEGAHRQESGGAHDWCPGHRGSHTRGRAQSHDLAGTPSVRPYRVNSWGEGKVPVKLDLCNNARTIIFKPEARAISTKFRINLMARSAVSTDVLSSPIEFK